LHAGDRPYNAAVSTAPAPDLTLPAIAGRHHFLFRRLHSLSGILFGLYVMVHLLVNATLIQGTHPTDIYKIQVQKIHSIPFLMGVEWALIFSPIIYHTIYGLWITFTGQPNIAHYPYSKNLFYFFQRLSALLLVFLLAFHVLSMKGIFGANSPLTFNPDDPTATAVRSITTYGFVSYVVYPLFILCACFHMANGFWAGAITWGLTISASSQRRWGVICLLIFLFSFTCGMLALVAAWMHRGGVS
jgi:succinate dehydrogenase / fumarate reductase cytochrome b subunit